MSNCPGPYIRQFAGYPRIGGATQDVRVTPGFGPWKQTFSRSVMAWTQHGDTPRTEDVGSDSWKRLHSSQGHARDDDEPLKWTFCAQARTWSLSFSLTDIVHLTLQAQFYMKKIWWICGKYSLSG